MEQKIVCKSERVAEGGENCTVCGACCPWHPPPPEHTGPLFSNSFALRRLPFDQSVRLHPFCLARMCSGGPDDPEMIESGLTEQRKGPSDTCGLSVVRPKLLDHSRSRVVFGSPGVRRYRPCGATCWSYVPIISYQMGDRVCKTFPNNSPYPPPHLALL